MDPGNKNLQNEVETIKTKLEKNINVANNILGGEKEQLLNSLKAGEKVIMSAKGIRVETQNEQVKGNLLYKTKKTYESTFKTDSEEINMTVSGFRNLKSSLKQELMMKPKTNKSTVMRFFDSAQMKVDALGVGKKEQSFYNWCSKHIDKPFNWIEKKMKNRSVKMANRGICNQKTASRLRKKNRGFFNGLKKLVKGAVKGLFFTLPKLVIKGALMGVIRAPRAVFDAFTGPLRVLTTVCIGISRLFVPQSDSTLRSRLYDAICSAGKKLKTLATAEGLANTSALIAGSITGNWILSAFVSTVTLGIPIFILGVATTVFTLSSARIAYKNAINEEINRRIANAAKEEKLNYEESPGLVNDLEKRKGLSLDKGTTAKLKRSLQNKLENFDKISKSLLENNKISKKSFAKLMKKRVELEKGIQTLEGKIKANQALQLYKKCNRIVMNLRSAIKDRISVGKRFKIAVFDSEYRKTFVKQAEKNGSIALLGIALGSLATGANLALVAKGGGASTFSSISQGGFDKVTGAPVEAFKEHIEGTSYQNAMNRAGRYLGETKSSMAEMPIAKTFEHVLDITDNMNGGLTGPVQEFIQSRMQINPTG